jgi:hypothetical protein
MNGLTHEAMEVGASRRLDKTLRALSVETFNGVTCATNDAVMQARKRVKHLFIMAVLERFSFSEEKIER